MEDVTRGMMHDRDSWAKLNSFKLYKLSHWTQAPGQVSKQDTRTHTMDVCFADTKENILHIAEEQIKMHQKRQGQQIIGLRLTLLRS